VPPAQRRTSQEIRWVASNCGCGDPIEVGRRFQSGSCDLIDYFEMPVIGDHPSKEPWKAWVRGHARHAGMFARALGFGLLTWRAELVHFQQVLNGYGSEVVFHWLHQPSHSARVITVHELDQHQQAHPRNNLT
jgi:hypothetical protein